jgi:hypothetical protein
VEGETNEVVVTQKAMSLFIMIPMKIWGYYRRAACKNINITKIKYTIPKTCWRTLTD